MPRLYGPLWTLIILALAGGCNDPAAAPPAGKPPPSFADRLRTLPSVSKVEVVVPASNPRLRIIHLLDRHYVARDLYAADLRDQDKSLIEEAIDKRYAEFLDEIESLQARQIELLRGMIHKFGLNRVFKEGFTDQETVAWELEIARLRTFDKAGTEGVVADADEIVRGAQPGSGNAIAAAEFKAQAKSMLDEYRRDLLRVGAPGRLLIAGELGAVLPADDDVLLANANPQQDDGRFRFDEWRIEAREDAIVKRLLKESGLVVIVLGQAHDLRDNVERLGGGVVELITVGSGPNTTDAR